MRAYVWVWASVPVCVRHSADERRCMHRKKNPRYAKHPKRKAIAYTRIYNWFGWKRRLVECAQYHGARQSTQIGKHIKFFFVFFLHLHANNTHDLFETTTEFQKQTTTKNVQIVKTTPRLLYYIAFTDCCVVCTCLTLSLLTFYHPRPPPLPPPPLYYFPPLLIRQRADFIVVIVGICFIYVYICSIAVDMGQPSPPTVCRIQRRQCRSVGLAVCIDIVDL